MKNNKITFYIENDVKIHILYIKFNLEIKMEQ